MDCKTRNIECFKKICTFITFPINRQKQDERNTFKLMIESLLRKVRNITSVNPNLISLKSHDIEIDWRKSLHNKTDSILHCITSVHVQGINSNLSIEVPNNSENSQSIQVHREDCFQSHEFMLNYKYKNETYFRQKIISMTFKHIYLNNFLGRYLLLLPHANSKKSFR